MTDNKQYNRDGLVKTASWEYKNQDGVTLGRVDRLDPEPIGIGSKWIIPHFNRGKQGEFKPGIPDYMNECRPLYGLESLSLESDDDIYIVEGEKCASALISLGFTCLTSLGGSNSANKADWSIFKDIKNRDVILVMDKDEPGKKYVKEVYSNIKKVNPYLDFRIINYAPLVDLNDGVDVCDFIEGYVKNDCKVEWDSFSDLKGVLTEDQIELVADSIFDWNMQFIEEVPAEWRSVDGSQGLSCIYFKDFLELDIPTPSKWLDPWLTEQSLSMIYANRGVGKTYFALNCAYALASSKEYLKYTSAKQTSVMYLDGEMQAPLLIDRLKGIAGENIENLPIQIITPDLQKNRGMPDLSTLEGQAEVDEMISIMDPKVIFVDNLSTLCRTGKENDSESWNMVQTWAIKHRSQGRSIVFVHHANKSGGQRGSSKKEDILDNVIFLQRPEDYDEAKDGAKFEVIFEKNRSLFGKDTATILASLDSKGNWQWEYVQSKDEKALEMLESGLKQKEIAKELGISASAVSKMINRAKEAKLNE